MAENALPEMETIQKRDFRTVTKTGNDLVKTITTTSDVVDHDEIIKEGLEAAIVEYVSIIVEKADLNHLISTEEKYKFLGKLDIKSIFEKPSERNPVASNKLNHQIEKLISDQKVIMKKMGVLDTLEQVIFHSKRSRDKNSYEP